MKLEKESKRNSDLNMLNKVFIGLVVLSISTPTHSQPIGRDISLPPVSFTRITEGETLNAIGLDPVGGAWCYEDDANAILITAPARERAKCELRLMYELEKQKVKYEFQIDKLGLRVETLQAQHTEINLIKDREIEKLTEAALKRPNEYSVWWAAGGFAAGVVTTGLIVWLTTSTAGVGI